MVRRVEAWGQPDAAAKWRKELDAVKATGREMTRPPR